MLATLLPIDAGQARVFGVDVARESHRIRQLVGTEPVPCAVANDRVGIAYVARLRDEHLQTFHAVERRLVAPDKLDQLLGPHRPTATRRQGSQQRLRPVARDRLPRQRTSASRFRAMVTPSV